VDEPAVNWETALRPWRAASTLVGLLQLPILAAAFILLITSDSSRAIAAAAAYAVFEGLRWAIDAQALRRYPKADFESFYRAAPLKASDRQLLTVLLFATPFEILGIGFALVTSFDLSIGTTALFLAVFSLSWALPIERVRRRNSWLAMSRLPGRPRRPQRQPKERLVAAKPHRSLGGSVLRRFALVLLAVVIAVLILVAIAALSSIG
jgi:hypothetical protein